ncbi:DoxX family protein [Ideonella sp. BN130291]|uniref:DoxX family protein n=1 Tax=Ideonella sp. BN130291 TaxID=3112940 RepID=UPI002E25F0CD|nr:DoxX family protein [Ideonella sp. BN130291]
MPAAPQRRPDTGNTDQADLAKLLLRVTLGVLILLHGIAKLKGGPDFVLGAVTKMGLPAQFGYLVYVGEVLAPVLLIVGYLTRAAAVVVAINMLSAVWLVHMPQLFTLSQTGGWALELQGLYFMASIVVALLGAGRYSLGGTSARWN